MRKMRSSYLGVLVLIGVMVGVPFVLGFNDYYLYVATLVVLYTTMVVAWNIIGGLAGQFDLAAVAYQALGGFITGLLLLWYGVTPWAGMFVGAIGAVLLALFIGFPTFRYGVKDVWYALATFAIVFILQKLFLVWEAVGGPVERRFPDVGWSWYYLSFTHFYPYFYLILAVFAAALIVNIRVRYSKIGYYLMAIRENEEAAAMLGVDVRKYKLFALIIYAFIVGITGGIFVSIVRYIHPSLFDSWFSLQTAVVGIVGGLGSTVGPPMTGLILFTVSEYLRGTLGGVTIFGETIFGLQQILYAIVVILVVVFKPFGLGPVFDSAIQWISTSLKLKRQPGTTRPTTGDNAESSARSREVNEA